MDSFGSRLKEARKAKGLTQKDLADRIGAKHNSISNWENDQNKPDPDTIELLCGVLDIEPNDLLKKSGTENEMAYRSINDSYNIFLKVNEVERNIVYNYREADAIDQEIVKRTLHLVEETPAINQLHDKTKYIPTEEDIRSLVARNGKKLTREEAIDIISTLFSDDDEE